MAFVVKDIGDMAQKIEEVIANGKSDGCYSGSKNGKTDNTDLRNQETTCRLIKKLHGIDQSDSNDCKEVLSTLAILFIQGVDIDWEAFYKGDKYKRISLPTYPFLRERYWVENALNPAEELIKDRDFDVCSFSNKFDNTREDLMVLLKKLEEKSISADDADRLTFVSGKKGMSPYA
jgi:hypothetical protein